MEDLHAKGVNGQVAFDGATITITRAGFLGRVGHGRGEKSLSVRAIGAVQIKPANSLVNGFIQFSVSGESSKQSTGLGRTSDAGRDENAVIFTKQQQPAFEAIRDAVRATQAAPAGATPAAPDLADQIGKLASLRDAGVLTEEEFAAKKADLLARM
ncbi:DUF4429 domain-containing protein [Microbacterium arborescens]